MGLVMEGGGGGGGGGGVKVACAVVCFPLRTQKHGILESCSFA
jgi:hypothetical protein